MKGRRYLYSLVALAVLIGFGCEKPNQPPRITSLKADPTRVVPGGTSTLSATAEDEDDDPISFSWSAKEGRLSDTTGSSVKWTAPDTAGSYSIIVIAEDGRGGTDDGYITVRAGQVPPNKPAPPSGLDEGLVDSTYSFIAITTDPDGDSIAYQFDWGDETQSDWSEFVPSNRQVEMSHAWESAGRYPVKVRAKDVLDDSSAWSAPDTIIIREFNNPPEIPTTPTGPASGNTETVLTFSASATDPDNESVKIQFDWGDETQSWSGFVPSGGSASASHTWTLSGPYEVRARATDGRDTSNFSGAHKLEIVANYPDHMVKTIPVGDCPRGIAILPNGSKAYVANYHGGSISVIQTANNTVVDEIPVNGNPEEIAILPNGTYLYVTTSDNDRVWPIRTSDNAVGNGIPVGKAPKGIAVLPNGEYLYVADNEADAVSVIKVSKDTVVATIPVGGNPVDIAVHPNGDFVYVTNAHSNSVSVIQTSDNSAVANIPVGSMPQGIAVSPDGSKAYVANYGDNTVSVIQTSDNRVVETIENVATGPTGIALLPDGNYLYLTNRDSHEVSVIRTSDHKVIASFRVGNSPRSIAVLGDGSRVYVTNHETDNVSVIGYYRP